MAHIEYVEDALENIVNITLWNDDLVDWKDLTILHSLNSAFHKEGALTQNQARLLTKILTRYRSETKFNFDLAAIIDNPKWKSEFRRIDLSKSVKVERDNEGILWVVMKFPYSLVKSFENTLITETNSHSTKWSPEDRVRKLKFYDFNIIAVDEFVRKNQFVIDDSFIEAVHQVEEIWQQQDNIIPYCRIDSNSVKLINAIDDAQEYFQRNKTGVLTEDLFLAKTMGFKLEINTPPANLVEKISQEINAHYWLRTNREFLELFQMINGRAAIILDRNTDNIIEWLEKFLNDAKHVGIDTSTIKVCFREPKDSPIPLNDWIKKNNLGGKVDQGRLFIFRQKPPKWIFANSFDIKIIGTNNFTPINDQSTLRWTQYHPCVCYISEIKPTKTRNKKIVNL